MVTVEEIGDPVAFVAVKLGVVFVPEAPKPTAVLLFVQLYVVDATDPVNVVLGIVAPVHTVTAVTGSTVGVGFTVIVKLVGEPIHDPTDGVTVTVLEIAVVPVFVAVYEAIFPVPLAANPVAVLLLVQPKVVPATDPEKATAVVATPLQYVEFATGFTVGTGLTVMT